jgi:hypothetical protein
MDKAAFLREAGEEWCRLSADLNFCSVETVGFLGQSRLETALLAEVVCKQQANMRECEQATCPAWLRDRGGVVSQVLSMSVRYCECSGSNGIAETITAMLCITSLS